ncbi:alpha/beta fold hydrolase [Dietzia sp. CH92]|uniref:alpha/beta hydrolase n=1 Tax=Dietzia sp. CH92 TaxID=3051823 RepID=UPI0028D20E25|nr:alpha/beta fold hydrolase [Dietzia sp. CH92]
MTIAALLIHGFGGDRAMWDPLAPRLERLGVHTHRLALSGHEDDAAALGSTPWTTWLAEMRAAVADLRGRADHVCLVGYSMGSTIGLHALAERLVDSAVLLCPSVSVPPVQRAAVGVLSTLRVREIPRRFVGTGDEEEPGQALPVAALRTNLEFKASARELELRDPAPTLLIAGGSDGVAGPEAVAEVLAKFPTGTHAVTLAGGDHALVDGPLADEVGRLVEQFLATVGAEAD